MEALDEIQWKSPEFIQTRGLNTTNVLEYFSLSPFYDRTSNNQVLMMQFQYQQVQIPPRMTFHQYFQNRLQEMTGVEFVIALVREPDFWIIRKQRRISPTSTNTLQDYYIVGANVYQAPRIYDVLLSRMLASVLALKKSAKTMNEMTSYHISDGGHSFNNSIHGREADKLASNVSLSSLEPQPMQSNSETPAPFKESPGLESSAINTVSPNLAQAQNQSSSTNSTTATATATATNGGAANNTISFSSSTFDALLGEVTKEKDIEEAIYLKDKPLYGPGSIVDQLGVRTNIVD